ncbi:MAG: hypothetical protein ABSH44_05000 [Bryobacteraceae bacterium]
MGKVIVATIALGAVAAIVVATRRTGGETPRAEQKSTQHVVLLDLSASPSHGQAAFWTQAYDENVARSLTAGDALLILGVHDNTDAAAPLFDDSCPAVDHDAGMDAEIAVRAKLKAMREEGRAKVREAFAASARANTTRLVEALPRVPRAGSRNVRVLFFSDMLEDSKLINLAKTPLAGRSAEMARGVAHAAKLRADDLRDATVECVLDNLAIGDKPRSVNSRAELREFWQALFESVGGHLVSFDTRMAQ